MSFALKDQMDPQRGTAFVETLLFTPLALFFLFVVTDAGLFLVSQGTVRDCLRSGVHSEVLFRVTDEAGSADIVAANVADEIIRGLERARFFAATSSYTVRTAVLELSVNANSGRIESSVSRVLASTERETIASYRRPAELQPDMDSYLREQLETETHKEPSVYALPLGIVYQAQAPTESHLGYLPKTYLLYAAVDGIPAGLSAGYVRSVLGTFYTLHEQRLQVLRLQQQ